MGIDAAGFAKVMLRRVRAPAVECKVVRAFCDFYRARDGRYGRRLSACAERTGAAAYVSQTVW